jgi:hypothetical protein
VNARAPERIVKRAFARGGARSSGFFLRVNAAALQRCAVSPQKAQGERETHGERYSLLSRSRFYACRATLIRGNSPSSSRSSALHARSVRTEWERWPPREQFERCRGVSLSLIRAILPSKFLLVCSSPLLPLSLSLSLSLSLLRSFSLSCANGRSNIRRKLFKTSISSEVLLLRDSMDPLEFNSLRLLNASSKRRWITRAARNAEAGSAEATHTSPQDVARSGACP